MSLNVDGIYGDPPPVKNGGGKCRVVFKVVVLLASVGVGGDMSPWKMTYR